MKYSIIVVLTGSLAGLALIENSSPGPGFGGGGVQSTQCITEDERAKAESAALSVAGHYDKSVQTPLFIDPMSGGGTNSFGRPVSNYVDLDAGAGLLDYGCGAATYNGHAGRDILIIDFYDMDEGIPFLAAANGVVVAKIDGFFDRRLACAGSANYVIIDHLDGSLGYYWHFKKNSIIAILGDTVQAGDTLGMIGSSGCSTWPHIHFEVRNSGAVVEPSSGACRAGSSYWQSQGTYVMDLPFELYMHGVTSLPMSYALMSERPPSQSHIVSPATIYSWIQCRPTISTDVLTWQLYDDGVVWTSFSFSPGTYASSWWYTNWNLPSTGNWEIRILHNGNLYAQQFFTYNGTPNQLPVALDDTYEFESPSPGKISGEFECVDPDGSPFWYVVQDGPSNGTLVQDGGRKRKFTYTPDPGFYGRDTVLYYAIDDDSAAGPLGEYVFIVTAPCLCDCHGDPGGGCDGSQTVLDVIETINVAFRSAIAIPDPNANCPRETTDVNCTGFTDVVDVTKMVNVAFRSADPVTEFCDPCP